MEIYSLYGNKIYIYCFNSCIYLFFIFLRSGVLMNISVVESEKCHYIALIILRNVLFREQMLNQSLLRSVSRILYMYKE